MNSYEQYKNLEGAEQISAVQYQKYYITLSESITLDESSINQDPYRHEKNSCDLPDL